jgi:hypothetical protein
MVLLNRYSILNTHLPPHFVRGHFIFYQKLCILIDCSSAFVQRHASIHYLHLKDCFWGNTESKNRPLRDFFLWPFFDGYGAAGFPHCHPHFWLALAQSHLLHGYIAQAIHILVALAENITRQFIIAHLLKILWQSRTLLAKCEQLGPGKNLIIAGVGHSFPITSEPFKFFFI